MCIARPTASTGARAGMRPGRVAGHSFGMRAAAVLEGGSRAPLRHAGSCGALGRRQGTPSACGRLRYSRAAAGHSFGMRAAAVLKGGGRAWPGFEPTRRAEGSRRGRRAGGPPPSGAESSWGGGPPPSGTEKGHQHCAVTIENGDPTHQQHGHQGPHERSSHVHNAEACITNLFHVINFQCIHSYDI